MSLGALRPGVNHVIVEAQTPDAADAACEVKHLMDMRKRFVLFDRSELIVPAFAHIGRLPNLAATLSSGFPYQSETDSLIFLPSRDRRALSARRRLSRPHRRRFRHARSERRVTFDREAAKVGSVLFFGALDDFPQSLIDQFGVDYRLAQEDMVAAEFRRSRSIVEPGGAAAPPHRRIRAQVFDTWAQGGHATPRGLFAARHHPRAL